MSIGRFHNSVVIRVRMQAMVAKWGSQRKLAKHLGYSVQYLNAVINGKKPPSEKLLSTMGIRKRVTYEQR